MAGFAGKADTGDVMRQRVAHDGQMGAATAGMLPDLVVVTRRVQSVIDIGVPSIEVLRGRLRALAVAVALIGDAPLRGLACRKRKRSRLPDLSWPGQDASCCRHLGIHIQKGRGDRNKGM